MNSPMVASLITHPMFSEEASAAPKLPWPILSNILWASDSPTVMINIYQIHTDGTGASILSTINKLIAKCITKLN